MQELTLTKPDDWHLHVRDGAALNTVVPHSARCFARAIIMPNLKPPVTSVEQALAYRERILQALPPGVDFTPLMTLYLTDNTRPEEIRRARDSGHVYAVKYYPAGATTHSESGVTDIRHTFDALGALADAGLPLLVHGEVTDPEVDIFDREKVFIEKVLQPVLEQFPELKIVFEHITTEEAVDFVIQGPPRLGATITPQHLLYNRNALFKGGMRPHYFCLPVLKRERHRQAVVAAATSGNPKFFLGTDSAPHARTDKESACGCAGIYSAPLALELYAEVFDSMNALGNLEAFASINGPEFYGLPVNAGRITLRKQPWRMDEEFRFAEQALVPLRAGQQVQWQIVTGG